MWYNQGSTLDVFLLARRKGKSIMPSTKVLLSLLILATLAAPAAAVADWVQSHKLTDDDGAARDYFGNSVAISGNTAIVGAVEDDDNGDRSGSAYLFDVASGVQLAKLTAVDGAAMDLFGGSVAVSGNTAILGAQGDDDNGHQSGSAYLFDAASGLQLAKLIAADGSRHDFFGYSVAVSGNTAIVGAHGDDDNGSRSGSAYLFDITSGLQLAKLTADDGAAYDEFGWSVGISGNTAIVGQYYDDHQGGSGSAYLFDVASGRQVAKLTADDGAEDDLFGQSVAISGNTAIVGAYLDDDNGYNSGSAYLFDVASGRQLAKLTAADGAARDWFGYSVAVAGNTAIVGAYGDDNKAGSAYLFDVTSGLQLAKLTAADGAVDDRFGDCVAISGNTAIVGAPYDADNGSMSGSAYLFVIPEPSAWLMLCSLLSALSVTWWWRRKRVIGLQLASQVASVSSRRSIDRVRVESDEASESITFAAA